MEITDEQIREIAIDVLQHFEELLAEHGIKIPDDDRAKGLDDSEACIYGSTYYTLEDNVSDTIRVSLKNLLKPKETYNAKHEFKRID